MYPDDIYSLIILLGKRCAGKTAFAKLLKTEYNFVHYEMSKVMKYIRTLKGYKHLILRKFVSFMHRTVSKEFGVKFMYERGFFIDRDLVITGIRNFDEIKFLKEYLYSYDIKVIYLYSNFFIRLKRAISRKKRNSIIQFLIEEFYSIKWGDSILKSISFVFKNESELGNNFRLLYNIVKRSKGSKMVGDAGSQGTFFN